MLGTVVFWLAVAFLGIWTFTEGLFMEVIILWALLAFFFFNPQISGVHLLWAFPMVLILGWVMSSLLLVRRLFFWFGP